MDDNYKTPLITTAIRRAAHNEDLAPGAIFHTDRGSNYTSYEFGTVLEDLDLQRSMGRTGIMLRQRDGGIFLRCAEERALQPDGLSDPSCGDERHCTVHRDPLQSEKASLRDRLPSTQRSARRLPIRTNGCIAKTESLSKKFRADHADLTATTHPGSAALRPDAVACPLTLVFSDQQGFHASHDT